MKKDLEIIKSEIINSIIEEISSYAATDSEKEVIKKELETRIKENILITDIPEVETVIDANIINKTMNELYIDLLTTFGIINTTSQNINGFETTNRGYIEFIESRIQQIRDKIESCQKSISSIHMPSIQIERFRNAESFNKTRSLQKDRFDQWIPSRCFVNYNEKEKYITLPYLRRDNSMRYDNKVDTAYININFQLGKGFLDLLGNNTDINNAIDGNDNTFWSETILSDAPFKVSFLDKKPIKMYMNDNYMYGIDNGAVCELEINFESVNTVNEIVLNPYCKYPIKLVAIRYKLTDDLDEELKEIVVPEQIEYTYGDNYIDGQVSFRFPDILCKKIFILFTQEHYLRDTYIYSAETVYKDYRWFKNKNDRIAAKANSVFKPLYYDRDLLNTNWDVINKKIVDSQEKDLKDIIINNDKTKRKIIKYEYQYGIRNISCFNNHFDRLGLYVSNPIKCNNSIKSLKIYTDEIHYPNVHDQIITDIEYYIAPNDSPNAEDWIPILPSNKGIIESEKLFIINETRAFLRFEADAIYSLMKNGEDITALTAEYQFHKNPNTNKYNCIQIFNYDYDAIYSVKYKPVENSDVIDLFGKVTTSVETFEGNNSSMFTIKRNPYIDETLDYCIIKLVDMSKDSEGIEIEAINITDTNNPGFSFLKFNNEINDFQFYIFKNNIYFNRNIDKKYKIDIIYRHLVSDFTIKAIMRRNTIKDTWITPIIKEIKYDVETV